MRFIKGERFCKNSGSHNYSIVDANLNFVRKFCFEKFILDTKKCIRSSGGLTFY